MDMFSFEEKSTQPSQKRKLLDQLWGYAKPSFMQSYRYGPVRGYGRRKKWRRKRRGVMGKTTVVYRQPFFAPLSYCCKVKWNQAYNMTGAAHYHKYIIGNSLYRPDAAATAQPLGFDQLAGLYDAYCVTSSKIYIQVDNNQSTPLNVCLTPNLETANPATATNAMGQQFNRHMMVAGNCTNMEGMTNFMQTKRLTGKKDPQDDPDMCGTFTANCTTPWYWHITATDVGGTDTTGWVTVQIVYWVRFTKANYCAPSSV